MEKGIVKEIKDNKKVIVNLDIINECNSCSLKHKCFNSKNCENLIETICEEDVKIGDIVFVEISSLRKVIFSIVIFLIPLAIMFLFYYIVKKIFTNELYAIISSFAGLFLYFTLMIAIYKKNRSLFKVKCYKNVKG